MDKVILAKKVSEYFKFMQDNLKKKFGPGVKSPFQIKDKAERADFFSQVKKLWAEHKSK